MHIPRQQRTEILDQTLNSQTTPHVWSVNWDGIREDWSLYSGHRPKLKLGHWSIIKSHMNQGCNYLPISQFQSNRVDKILNNVNDCNPHPLNHYLNWCWFINESWYKNILLAIPWKSISTMDENVIELRTSNVSDMLGRGILSLDFSNNGMRNAYDGSKIPVMNKWQPVYWNLLTLLPPWESCDWWAKPGKALCAASIIHTYLIISVRHFRLVDNYQPRNYSR